MTSENEMPAESGSTDRSIQPSKTSEQARKNHLTLYPDHDRYLDAYDQRPQVRRVLRAAISKLIETFEIETINPGKMIEIKAEVGRACWQHPPEDVCYAIRQTYGELRQSKEVQEHFKYPGAKFLPETFNEPFRRSITDACRVSNPAYDRSDPVKPDEPRRRPAIPSEFRGLDEAEWFDRKKVKNPDGTIKMDLIRALLSAPKEKRKKIWEREVEADNDEAESSDDELAE